MVSAKVMNEPGVTVGAAINVEIGFGIEVSDIPEVIVSTMLSLPES